MALGFAGAGFPGTGPSPGAPALDGPPPSPTPMGDAGSGFSMRGIAGPGPGPVGQIPTSGMPPEVLTGVTQSAQAVSDLLDSWAQIMPDQGPQIGLVKDMIQQILATAMQNGAGPVSPTAAGPAFPGGGMDRGVAGPGAI